ERLAVVELRHGIAGCHRLDSTRHEYPPIGTFEPDAVRKITADDHVDAIGIDRFRFERSMNIPQAALREFRGAPDFDGAREFGVHAPMRAVDVMGAPAGDHAGTELLAAKPSGTVVSGLRMHPLFRIRNDGG